MEAAGFEEPLSLDLGAAADLVPTSPAELTPAYAEYLAGLGIRALVTHFPLASLSREGADAIRTAVENAGLRIVQAAGYRTNFVDPDESRRLDGINTLGPVFEMVKRLNAEMFITGCGSLSAAGFYGPARENYHSETRRRLIDSLRKVARIAEANGVLVALECHHLTTLDTPEHIAQVVEQVGSPMIRVNFDPVNLLGDLPSAFASGDAMRRMRELLGEHYVKAAHLKDIVVGDSPLLHLSEASPGTGLLDIAEFLRTCRMLGEGAAVVIEHMPRDDAVTAIDYLKDEAKAADIVFR